MIERFKGLSTSSKALVGAAVGLVAVALCGLIIVLATGGFTSPL